jgi:NADPH:quinone reductase-like Zn-dependent oxidoreductase
MEYAPIDYSDLLLANGVYFLNPKLPSVIGGEGAGIVEAIGPGVTSVKVGDRVTIPFGTFTWSEKVLAPAEGLFVVPPSIDARTASMLNINPTTAVLLLDEFVKLKAKDWIVLNAANSHVARCLIAIAKSRDLKLVGIVRRSELIPEIEKLGVDFVGVESPELPKQIQNATGGVPISLGLDAVGGPATATMASVLSPGAHLVSYAWLSGLPIHCAARRSHWQEAKHPRLLDVLRRVSPKNSSGTDRGSKSSRFRQINFTSHHNIQTIPNQRSNRTLPAWWQSSIGFQSAKLAPCPTTYRPC